MKDSDRWLPEEAEDSTNSLPDEPSLVVGGEEVVPARRRSCWFNVLAVLLVLAMSGTAVVSALWVMGQLAVQTAVSLPLTKSFAEPTGTPLPEPGRIAFITENGQVMTMAPDGGDGRLLTAARFRHQFPAWSPDGKRLAVIGRDAIYLLQDAADSAPRELYASSRENPFYLYWAPDGRSLSFLANDALDGIALRLLDAEDPANERRLASGTPLYWHWSTDSRQMLVHTGESGAEASLALLSASGEGEGQEIAMPGSFQAPAISADGLYWAYADSTGDGDSRLIISEVADGVAAGRELLRERHAGMVALSWSPTAPQLAFTTGLEARSRSFWGPLRLFDAETGEERLLSRSLVLAFFWSPDGRHLAVIHSGRSVPDGGVNALRPESENGRRPVLGKMAQPPDAHRFYLSVINVATGASDELLAFTPSTMFIAQFLPFFDQYARSHRLWSPDSQFVVLPVREGDENHVKVIPIDGRAPLDLGVGDMPFWSP
jgi:TolB protein